MDQVAQVREKIDLVSLIQEYIPLKKAGRNFKTVCPFHNEKTPSFVISPERQIWHCFGCQKGGDCFTFLMEYEKLEFPEALRALAKKAGVELKESFFQTGLSSKKDKIYSLNRLALDFYHYVLTKHNAGKKALSYLENTRKIDNKLIETFSLGFSPKEGNALSNFLVAKKKYQKGDLIEAGISFDYRGRLLDFFRNRVMFPLFDHRGNIVGFSGRVIDPPAGGSDGGKYINTRETLVYHKGGMFFGLNTAKEEIKKLDKVIVTEGEFDVISMFSQGYKNAIAIKGTALTEDQANLLARFTKNIALCLDQDKAGSEATKRSFLVLEEKGFATTVVLTPNGKDPDEAIKIDPVSFKKALKSDISIYDYFFNNAFASFDKDTAAGTRKITEELLPIFMYIGNEIVKEHFLKKLAKELNTSYESLLREIEKISKKEIAKDEIILPSKDRRERTEILEEYLLALIIQSQSPTEIFGHAKESLKDYKFNASSMEKIVGFLDIYFKTHQQFDIKQFSSVLPQELLKTFDICFLLPMPKLLEEGQYQEETQKTAKELRSLFLKDKIKFLSQDLKNKEKDKKPEEIKKLEEELSELIHLLSTSSSVVQ